jgi:hypothetical protein
VTATANPPDIAPAAPSKILPIGDDRIYEPYVHRALELQPPERDEPSATATVGTIHRRDRLGGLIHEYYRAAA